MRRIAALLILLASIQACSGEDSGSGPTSQSNGPTTNTLLSGSRVDDWDVSGTFYWKRLPMGGDWEITDRPAVMSDFRSNSNEFRVLAGGGIMSMGQCLSHKKLNGTVSSRNKVDLSQYDSARMRFAVVGQIDGGSPSSGAYAQVEVIVRSNVPGIDDLSIRFERTTGEDFTKDVDVSLESVLSFKEATVDLVFGSDAFCHPSGNGYEIWLAIKNFTVTGTKE